MRRRSRSSRESACRKETLTGSPVVGDVVQARLGVLVAPVEPAREAARRTAEQRVADDVVDPLAAHPDLAPVVAQAGEVLRPGARARRRRRHVNGHLTSPLEVVVTSVRRSAASCARSSAPRPAQASDSSALKRGKSSSNVRSPAAVSATVRRRPSSAWPRRCDQPAALERVGDARDGRARDAHAQRQVARLVRPPDPQAEEHREARPGQALGLQRGDLEPRAQRGGGAEDVLHDEHRRDVELAAGRAREHVDLFGQQLLLEGDH